MKKVETIVEDRINRISPCEQMLQIEFWYILIFHNCALLTSSCSSKIQTIIDAIKNDAANNPKNYPNKKVIMLVSDYLNTKNGFFIWDSSRKISDNLTYRTFQRTLFKRYKGLKYGIYSSID